MAPERLSRLQRRILAWLLAEDQRTRGTMAASHEDLVRGAGTPSSDHRRAAGVHTEGGMVRKPWWGGLLGTLALIVIASGCGPPRPWGEEYPGPWQEDSSTEDFRAIVKALSVNDVRGCGEFHYRPSAHHSHEYLVYCTRDGKVWRAYQVWPRITQVTGPQPPAVGVPPPY